MNVGPRAGDTLEAVRRAGVETTGIEIIEEADRIARPADLFVFTTAAVRAGDRRSPP